MTEFQYVKEFLSTAKGTEGSLLIPKKIHAMLIEETEKALIPRSEAMMYLGPSQITASSLDLNLATPDSLQVRQLGEYNEIEMDEVDYTNINIRPAKYGVSIRITKDLLEDAQFNLLQHNIRVAGKRLAENENSLIVTQLDTAANTIGGGAAITIANITRAMQYLEDNDFNPTTFALGMEVANDIRNIDTFTEVDKSGSNDMLSRGFIGNIYGMKVYKVSTNAGMTTTSSYVFDREFAYVIGEKRPLTVENFDLPLLDSKGAAITQRITAKAVRTNAIAKITTS